MTKSNTETKFGLTFDGKLLGYYVGERTRAYTLRHDIDYNVYLVDTYEQAVFVRDNSTSFNESPWDKKHLYTENPYVGKCKVAIVTTTVTFTEIE